MQKTIKNKTYAFIDGAWTGVDKNGKVFKVTVKSLLEELNKVEDKETFTPLVGEWKLTLDIDASDKEKEIKEEFQKESVDDEQSVDLSGVKVKEESKGLGDTIKSITSALGIEPCESCNKRAEKLNKWFPYLKRDVRDLTETETELVKRASSTHTIEWKDVKSLFVLYNDVFGAKLEVCRCPGLLSKIVERTKVLLKD